jgi:hypothetical protein
VNKDITGNRLSSPSSSSREKSGAVLNNPKGKWLVYVPHTLTLKTSHFIHTVRVHVYVIIIIIIIIIINLL